MAAQAKVIIKGQNDIGGAVKSAAADLGSLKGAATKLGGVLKGAFADPTSNSHLLWATAPRMRRLPPWSNA
jgi:hypothetical protein